MRPTIISMLKVDLKMNDEEKDSSVEPKKISILPVFALGMFVVVFGFFYAIQHFNGQES